MVYYILYCSTVSSFFTHLSDNSKCNLIVCVNDSDRTLDKNYLFFKRIYVPPTYDSHFCAAINVTTSITVTIMSQMSDPNIQVL